MAAEDVEVHLRIEIARIGGSALGALLLAPVEERLPVGSPLRAGVLRSVDGLAEVTAGGGFDHMEDAVFRPARRYSVYDVLAVGRRFVIVEGIVNAGGG